MTMILVFVDIWTQLNTIGTITGAGGAIAGLFFVGYQLRQNSMELQLQALESIFRDIRELDRTWIENKFLTEMSPEAKTAWCATFFNTIEYLSFLINRNLVRQVELREFFRLGLPAWAKQFGEYRSKKWFTDRPELFKEFKDLCKAERIMIP
jgi:hypothetical protein